MKIDISSKSEKILSRISTIIENKYGAIYSLQSIADFLIQAFPLQQFIDEVEDRNE